jgi:hypothetical protein
MPVQIGSFLVIPLWCKTGTEMVSSNCPKTMTMPGQIAVFISTKWRSQQTKRKVGDWQYG